jgi:hypothetical protein
LQSSSSWSVDQPVEKTAPSVNKELSNKSSTKSSGFNNGKSYQKITNEANDDFFNFDKKPSKEDDLFSSCLVNNSNQSVNQLNNLLQLGDLDQPSTFLNTKVDPFSELLAPKNSQFSSTVNPLNNLLQLDDMNINRTSFVPVKDDPFAEIFSQNTNPIKPQGGSSEPVTSSSSQFARGSDNVNAWSLLK